MKDFLTKYAQHNAQLEAQSEATVRDAFIRTTELIADTLGKKAFRIKTAFNAAVFDSVMVGLSKRLSSENPLSHAGVQSSYHELLKKATYKAAVEKATAREDQVAVRMKLATEAFAASL